MEVPTCSEYHTKQQPLESETLIIFGTLTMLDHQVALQYVLYTYHMHYLNATKTVNWPISGMQVSDNNNFIRLGSL